MGEIALALFKWTAKSTFFLAVILALMVMAGIVYNYIVIGVNMTVIGEIVALIQIWLPFNFYVMLGWMTVTITAYIAWRSSLLIYSMINSYLGRS